MNEANRNGRTALHLACGVGDEQVVMALLDARADPNIQTFDQKKRVWRTALEMQANSGKWFSQTCFDRLLLLR